MVSANNQCFSGPKDLLFTIKHYFREGLITLSLEYFKVSISIAVIFGSDRSSRF